MILNRTLLACCVLALPGTLGGCVAAAIPMLAAGGMAVRETASDEADDRQAPVVLVGREPAAKPVNPYAEFYLHASAQSRFDPVDNPRNSAILATPGSLQPVTSECGILPPAVLIDLDPSGGILEFDKLFSPNPDLAEVLADLRLEGVAVFWISGATAAEAGKVRTHLLVSGLDPVGRDGLLLKRRADDRKDIRRRELSRTHCVVAILGDARGDFDELFDYLREPSAAAALDNLLGAGWFLTPPPIVAKES